MPRVLKFCALLLVNVVVALIGSAIAERAIVRLIPTHSIVGVVQREWALSIVCAALSGVGMWRTWRSSSTTWAWTLPAAWFALRFVFAIGGGRLWFQFSGTGCENSLSAVECRNFFLFTV
ncbi:MAG TPA: hypothetical protein VFU76_14645, partial [Terriglobales bacterium]|nr:hypothetical protein [Terriglobales bacterium]